MARALPPRFDEVTIPDLFSVTAVAFAGGCRLRAVLASSPRGPSGLPTGPRAELGTLAHAVLERAAQSDGDAQTLFDSCLRVTRERLELDADTHGYSDLAATMGPSSWSRFRADVLTRCAQILPRVPRKTQGATVFPLRGGAEKTFSSEKLRLKGRLDKLARTPDGRWQITDHKLGQIRDRAGQIHHEIIFQLSSYGLLTLERDPTAEIRLVVDDGQEHEISFDARARAKARREIRRVWRKLEPGSRVPAIDIATPGENCADCPFRHRCSAYLMTAPTWWKLNPATPDELARDAWGTVLAVERDTDRTSVTLRDACGRQIRIDRLDSRHGLDGLDVGKSLWLFGLESTVWRRTADGRSIQPTTFHEHPADSAQYRAWALSVFQTQRLPGAGQNPLSRPA